jgi:anaerobic ribonucleoside-triphosphate reductase activating protein
MPFDLQIAGLQKLSSVDWPGKLAAVAFLQGCPWTCDYCHNKSILDPLLPGVVEWDEVVSLLGRRKGLLDGLVFSGGEATRQASLPAAAAAVKDMGFQVGLHTGGAYPKRFKALLDAGTLDWVGFDVKALPGDYGQLTGSPVGATRAEESLEMLLAHPEVDYEVRLTLWKGGLEYARQVAAWCAKRGVKRFALQAIDGKPTWEDREAHDALSGFNFEWIAVR